jgi:hypothetical protein
MSETSVPTNHARVLACISREPEVRLRGMAPTLGITKRSMFRMVDERTLDGSANKEKVGRRNRYHVQVGAPFSEGVSRSHDRAAVGVPVGRQRAR